jgi:hypothetical protein
MREQRRKLQRSERHSALLKTLKVLIARTLTKGKAPSGQACCLNVSLM